MSAGSLAARGRAAAEEIMTDACSIARITGQVLNPATGQLTPTSTTVYAGKCRVKAPHSTTAVGETQIGETVVASVSPVVSIPVTVTTVTEGDRVTVTASTDAGLVGTVLLVKAVQHGTHITARRLLCEELTNA